MAKAWEQAGLRMERVLIPEGRISFGAYLSLNPAQPFATNPHLNGPMSSVIRRKGASVDADDLKTHVQSQLARFKVPRDIVFVENLPRTALGKVQHFMLRQIDANTPVRGGVA